ncbi:hypothetical protein [Gloeocapsa sp. PCC 73106]|uniref:hypothetical protein n=1 Tax=Gloeocapsa sp. PCC 73106 TaxID=102232 RepID=UPI0002ABAFA5|nr:hypothetical protein [Gloeocapsa sp. PCC 73106]ELR99410.1 hypothetical protein GLO73106DRAFT_00032610 [Gloeocapsa sp. PCC 73106]
MTVENLQENGTQMENQESQETALSIPNQDSNKQGLNLKFSRDHHLPNNRPVEAGHLQVVKTFKSVGSLRPITKGNINISSNLVISGNRPIAARTLQISETYSVMGNRPVASNHIDDTVVLMGFID